MVSLGPPWRVYDALARYVVDNDLDPHCFGMTYGRVPISPTTLTSRPLKKAIRAAEDAELLKPARPRNCRKRRLATLYCLRGVDETMPAAIQRGMEADTYQTRLLARLAIIRDAAGVAA